MKRSLAALTTALVMMLTTAAPAMADGTAQDNLGDATANNYNTNVQINIGVQNNVQFAMDGNNYADQELYQVNYNATGQDGAAFAGNILGL